LIPDKLSKEKKQMKILIAGLLVVHGFIVASQSSGSFNPVGGVKNPAWLSWWPVNLGQSWLLSPLGIERSLIAKAGGLLWLVAGIALIAAGLGALGFIIPHVWWRSLALIGAAISLFMLSIYLHPLLGVGISASVILLLVLLWQGWPILVRIGL
jgi:hypothetical protein